MNMTVKKYLFRFCIIFSVMLIAGNYASVFCAQKKNTQNTEDEITILRQLLDATRDSLQNDIASRWRAKQKSVEQREKDKEEISALREEQEKSVNNLQRSEEEFFTEQRNVEDAGNKLKEKSDEWTTTASALKEALSREASYMEGIFPVDMESRQNDIENLRNLANSGKNLLSVIDGYYDYVAKYAVSGNSANLSRQTLLTDDNKTQLMTIARFGNVFGYCINEKGDIYFIRQGGNTGNAAYSIDKINDPALHASLLHLFPSWIQTGTPSGQVPTDIMQNEQTKILISGKKVSSVRRFYDSLKAGGAIMIPLLALPLWVFVLMTIKLFQFTGKRRIFSIQYEKTAALIDKGDYDGAMDYLKKCSGMAARMLETCIMKRNYERTMVEKSIRELFIEEMPHLNKYLNTLAVIAGAAPLLGLLGTISGMITLFGAVTHYGSGDPKFLAGGISEALITAKTGLAIAIPTLFIHDYLRNKKDGILADMEKYGLRIINKIFDSNNSAK
jgi:biopolymer transport protein ExbB